MTNKEIIDYVLHTPNNINPSILRQKLQEQDFENRPDWNQNDENAANFIKNRPFYSSDVQRISYLDEMIYQIDESNEWVPNEDLPIDLEGLGDIYFKNMTPEDINSVIFTVQINGVEYKTPIYEWNEGHCTMGYSNLTGGGELSDETPFFIDFYLDPYIDESMWGKINYISLHHSIAQEINSFSVYVDKEEIRTIDSKYLPGHDVLIDDDNEVMTVGTYDILRESIKNLKVPNAAVYAKSDSSIEVSACKSARLENGGITLVFDAGNGNILYKVKPDGSVFWFE